MKTIQENISLRIRKKRMRLGFTQQYMAKLLKQSQTSYSNIELGRTKITLVTLIEICNIFKISIEDFLTVTVKRAVKGKLKVN